MADRYSTFHDLEGRSVFISGGGSGIGAALTEGFLEQGARVTFVQRSDASEFVEEMAERHDNRPFFIPCDVTDTDALREAIGRAAAEHGPVTVLVNNAANDNRHDFQDFSVSDWDKSLAVNLRHHYFAAQTVAPGMRDSGGGAVINFSSISYIMGETGYLSYVTAKAGITGLTRGLARELGPDKIRVNAVLPGWVLTERQLEKWATEEDLEAHLGKQCLKEHVHERDIVGTVLFLASGTSRMMTSQALIVDGGVVVTG